MRKSVLFLGAALLLAAGATSGMANAQDRAARNLPAAGQAVHQAAPIILPGKKGKSDFAVVNSDGSLARGRGVASIEVIDTGITIAHFTKDKTACAYTATIGLGGSSGTSAPGYVTVVGSAVDPNGVFMETFDTTGALASLGYHLVTTC
ncbi:MAG TPA: hypothetical protein VHC42_01845 [Rhizomicrobium sp.]|nr:hypothetical protein [Rhizomicrobium sp.]